MSIYKWVENAINALRAPSGRGGERALRTRRLDRNNGAQSLRAGMLAEAIASKRREMPSLHPFDAMDSATQELVYVRARTHARSRGRREPGTLDVLALLVADRSPAMSVLEDLGIDIDAMDRATASPDHEVERDEDSLMTDELHRVLDRYWAFATRAQIKDDRLALLCALAAVPECSAAGVLRTFGLDARRLQGEAARDRRP